MWLISILHTLLTWVTVVWETSSAPNTATALGIRLCALKGGFSHLLHNTRYFENVSVLFPSYSKRQRGSSKYHLLCSTSYSCGMVFVYCWTVPLTRKHRLLVCICYMIITHSHCFFTLIIINVKCEKLVVQMSVEWMHWSPVITEAAWSFTRDGKLSFNLIKAS